MPAVQEDIKFYLKCSEAICENLSIKYWALTGDEVRQRDVQQLPQTCSKHDIVVECVSAC